MSDNKSKAVEAKNRGNTFFAANKHADAVAAFSQAIDLDPSEHVRSAFFSVPSNFL
jgi:predicted negative regulator of RcsB-dependent stress response